MHNQIKWLAVLSFALALACVGGAFYTQDFYRDLLLALFGVWLSVGIGLILVNVFLDKKSRQIAAGPLVDLIAEPITRYHNELMVVPMRSKFGIPEFGRISDAYNSSNGNPQVFSQEDRRMLNEVIEENLSDILQCITDIDSKLSDLVSVLGWSYDAKIIASALTCKKNISGFKSVTSPQSDAEKLKRIENYIDIDASSASVILNLSQIYGQQLLSDE